MACKADAVPAAAVLLHEMFKYYCGASFMLERRACNATLTEQRQGVEQRTYNQ